MLIILKGSCFFKPYISQIVEFCDKDDPDTPSYMRHDSRAINEQNDRCGHRSCWEVMREHEDFKDGKRDNFLVASLSYFII